MARLDRLGRAKEVAQVGAALGREFSHAMLAAVMRKPDAELKSALDRIVGTGLLSRQGVPPHATYLFKHALVQDAAYGTLLREQRRVLHSRIADVLESQFTDIAENQPELLARHCTEAGLIEKAAGLWGKAGQRSLERSALAEAIEQLTRALDQIGTLPSTTALRREQIKVQVALITPLIHVHGYAAPETKAAAESAHRLIEQAEAVGEPPEDRLLLFSVLYGYWVGNFGAFNAYGARNLAAQFLAFAEKQDATSPLTIGHRIMAISLMFAGDLAQARMHFNQAFALYNPVEHRALATRFGHDPGVAIHSFRSLALWLLGYADAALADAEEALQHARKIGQAGTLMYALFHTAMFAYFHCGDYATTRALLDELIALADEKGSPFWRADGQMLQGSLLALTGKPSDAVPLITTALAAWRSTGATLFVPVHLSCWARAYSELGKFDDAWRCIGEAVTAIEATKETWCESQSHRWRNRTYVSSGRSFKGASVFRARAWNRPSATSQVVGASRLHEPRTALARPGKNAASS